MCPSKIGKETPKISVIYSNGGRSKLKLKQSDQDSNHMNFDLGIISHY